LTLKHPFNGEKISLLTDKQKDYLKTDRSCMNAADFDYLSLQKSGDEDFSLPWGIDFEWDGSDKDIFQLSEYSDFRESIQTASNGICRVYNLKCNTRYYWRVFSDGECSEVFSFCTTDEYPRFIKIDGLSNVRDCGGWKSHHGGNIKQGMLYRGGELDPHMHITDEGLKTMAETLKIKSVLDLRRETELTGNIYGKAYKNVPVTAYAAWFEQPYTVMKEIFDFLSNRENYPVYFHCWGGADRTGTLAFLLGCILGMSEEDLVDDYELTTLSIWGARSRNAEHAFKGFLDVFNGFDGKTLYEKAENYFLMCGISKESIQSFREIMLA